MPATYEANADGNDLPPTGRSRLFWVVATVLTLGFAAVRLMSEGALDALVGHPEQPIEQAVIRQKPIADEDRALASSALGVGGKRSPETRPRPHAGGGPYAPLVVVPSASSSVESADLPDEAFVIGVEVNGETRAYPLDMMSPPVRRIVNDTLGGEPIAVTWCGECRTPLVFSRRFQDRALTFFVTGEFFGRTMMMEDVETHTGWAQMIAGGVRGPLKGHPLDQIAAIWTYWKTWRTVHPESTVLGLTFVSQRFRRQTEPARAQSEHRFFNALQWGLSRDGGTISWPFAELARVAVVNDECGDLPLLILFDDATHTAAAFDRRVGGRTLAFQRRDDALLDDDTGSVWDAVSGRALSGPLAGERLAPVAGTIASIDAWRIFHPDSQLRSAGRHELGRHEPALQ